MAFFNGIRFRLHVRKILFLSLCTIVHIIGLDEHCYITIGRDFLSRILAVVYTFRDIIIRIISVRRATAHQREMYEEQNEEGI
jgi:uncharacterized DUF497 family protein